MGQVKEADFLRWGNTKRVTGLRKQEQDGIWEGLRDRMLIFVSRCDGNPWLMNEFIRYRQFRRVLAGG